MLQLCTHELIQFLMSEAKIILAVQNSHMNVKILSAN